ncbi:Leucine-rich repeat - like 10 [Theobroma cacao]|nr:Leucine-rich repeat - like 10 [Theobroma cacao]
MGYDVVIWVVVSKDHYIETVQEKIGQKLSLSHDKTWKNKSFDERAVEIWKVLSKKKFVMLLDDVWERVDLTKVGIPEPDQKNGSKLIFTTRSLDVCGQMGARKNIKVECLSKDDAWKLFEEKVGEETLDSHLEIRGLAKQVAAKCGGLPLALITIGRAMAYSTMPKHWEHAINVLKEFPHKLASMDKEVYSLLKFSYDSLPTDTMRSCLLYCSLYPKNFEIPIDELKDYWFCEGILDESDNIVDARMQGEGIIKHLVNACLLERCGDFADRIKMHDVICDMALWIARECEAPEKRFFVRTGVRSIKAVDDENWKVVRMSLAYSRIEDLEGTPTCPNLQTLFLNDNKLKVISDGFFQFMHNLKVLNLSSNHSLSEDELATQVDVRLTEPTVGLEPTLDKVWRLLEQNNVGIIGLHGLGGVGKTTLLTQINNKLSNDLVGHDVVIWVVVSKDHTIENVQEKIGEKVGLSNELGKNKGYQERAIDIWRVLSKTKFVLLLDDVWEQVDWIKVGIPKPNQENGSKLIFTTRSLDVGEETLDSHPDIRRLAKQVASMCGGLPLALITIGRTMACKKMSQDWKYAIEVLKEFLHKLATMDQEVSDPGCFSKNCKSSYKFGKQVTRKLEEIVDLKNIGVFERVAENELAAHVDVIPNEIAENEFPAQVDVRPTEPTVALKPTLVKVWRLLEENNVGIIGLHGLGGVGKTTLLTQINNKLSNDLIGYDVVIWVVVSKDHTIQKVQEKLGDKVGLSNELEVCGEMGARKNIKVECLSRDEAWKLFEEKVGEETLDSHSEIRGLAKQVAAKCGGLPLALITIGRAMASKKMPQDWKYAMEVLKQFPHKLARMDQEVYSLLKFSYDSLANDTMRSCLLYCSLYLEDFGIRIDELIDYWFCEGFLANLTT